MSRARALRAHQLELQVSLPSIALYRYLPRPLTIKKLDEFVKPKIAFMPSTDLLTRKMIVELFELKEFLNFEPVVIFATRTSPTHPDTRLAKFLSREYFYSPPDGKDDVNSFYEQLCLDHQLSYSMVSKYNSESFIELIRSFAPVAALTLRMRARLGTQIIDLFEQELDAPLLNLHPGTLPDFRGLHATTNSMIQRRSYNSYSIHELSEEYDTGAVVASAAFPIDYSESVLMNLLCSWRTGLGLAIKTLSQVTAGQPIESIAQHLDHGETNSNPTVAQMDFLEEIGIDMSRSEDLEVWEQGWALVAKL